MIFFANRLTGFYMIETLAADPFLVNAPILHPLKTPKHLWFSDVFKGNQKGTLARNGLQQTFIPPSFQDLPFNIYQNKNALKCSAYVIFLLARQAL